MLVGLCQVIGVWHQPCMRVTFQDHILCYHHGLVIAHHAATNHPSLNPTQLHQRATPHHCNVGVALIELKLSARHSTTVA